MNAMMAADLPRHRFTVAEYEQMGRAGVLGPDDRTELLDGEVVMMSPIGPRHGGVVNRVSRMFHKVVGDDAVVTVQNPVVLGRYSEPEPDIVVARPRADFYAHAHLSPDDILLMIEVADSTLAKDSGVKVPLYAQAGIPEVWVVDVDTSIVYVHTVPRAGTYNEIREVTTGDTVTPRQLPDSTFAVADLLG